MLIDNMQGPDKGLLDVLFGKKPGAAQAQGETPATGQTEQKTSDDFTQLLVQAQDQQDAQTAKLAALTKDGSKQVKSPEATDAKQKAAVAAAVAAAAEAKQKGVAGEKKADKPQDAKANIVGDEMPAVLAAQAQAQAQALALAQAQAKVKVEAAKVEGAVGPQAVPAVQTQKQTQTQGLVAKGATASAKAQVSTAQAAATTALEMQQALAVVQQAAVSAQQAAANAQQTAVNLQQMAAMQGQAGAQNPVVLQPIVIQVPMAIPVDVIEVGSDDFDHADFNNMPQQQQSSAFQSSAPALTASSQDFLAQRGILGVDRIDPRLGRLNEEHSSPSKGQADGRDAMPSLMIPQVGAGQVYNQAPAAAKSVDAAASAQVAQTSGGKAEIANTMMLAAQVRGLAAQGGGSIKMKVMPESLGEITIHVQSEGQKLNVKFEASSDQGREALANALPEIRQMLSAGRYEVGSLAVDRVMHAAPSSNVVSMNDSQQSFNDWNQNNDSQGSQHRSAWDRYMDQRDGQQSQSDRHNGRARRYYQQQQEMGA